MAPPQKTLNTRKEKVNDGPPVDTYVGVYRSTFTTIYDRLTWRLKIKHTLEKKTKNKREKGNNSP